MFKEKKWYNFGDVNPRINGGIFVKRDGDEIEVVSTDNLEEIGVTSPYSFGEGGGYHFNQRSDYVSDLKLVWERFKDNPDERGGVASCMDWKRYLKMDMDWDTLVYHLAVDMIGYYGGDCEIDFDTNYWGYLKSHGITPNNFN